MLFSRRFHPEAWRYDRKEKVLGTWDVLLSFAHSKMYREKCQNGSTHTLDACWICFVSIIIFRAVTNTAQSGLRAKFSMCTKTFIQTHGAILGVEMLRHGFEPRMFSYRGQPPTSFFDHCLQCKRVTRFRAWTSLCFARLRQQVPHVGPNNEPSKPFVVIALRLRLGLQQPEYLFIGGGGGGVRFRLQFRLRHASLSGEALSCTSTSTWAKLLGHPGPGQKKRVGRVCLGFCCGGGVRFQLQLRKAKLGQGGFSRTSTLIGTKSRGCGLCGMHFGGVVRC